MSTKTKPKSPQISKPAQETPPATPQTEEVQTPQSLLTRPLGLEGWAHLEAVVLAALASGDPLLLIGRHGTAKSFLLERLAESLDLAFRFYNASLVNYDDLVGIPVPDETQTSLRYISTPSSIWDAEVVFIDEISRA
ncbi:MAG: AAA family ATPase, partial [Verrucomicrobia bacterium]|nr:AAA family ATPase [Verrucomicrobiota bacterium]